MNDLRKTADMAHEALVMWEQLDPHHSLNVVRAPAINALAEALAQPDEVAAEREACAKLCEEKETYGDPVQCWLDDCAASIRARGKSNDQT